MRILISRPKPADPSFAIGLGLIVTLAAAEIFGATLHYLNHMRAARTRQSVAMASVQRPAFSATTIRPRPGSSPAISIPSPPGLSTVDRLLQEAIELRDRDDTTTALARLHQASERDPNNAMVLEETAKTYESMQLFDRSNATIDHTKVKILVKFYDTVDDKEVKLTDADVNYEWLTSKHDWVDTNPEILSVNYLRPKKRASSPETELFETAAAVKPQKGRPPKIGSSTQEKRKYLGYEILIYYYDKLQVVQAEPTRLLQLFPPSESISSP